MRNKSNLWMDVFNNDYYGVSRGWNEWKTFYKLVPDYIQVFVKFCD
jgi:hypothetical protein